MNCTAHAPMLVALLCIFMSSTGQTYEISIAHDDSDKKEIIVSWYKDGSFSHDSIFPLGETTVITFDSYHGSTLHEISLCWDHKSDRHRTKLFPLFEGAVALAHGVSCKSYLWRLKMDGVYCSKEKGAEELYETWESLQQKEYTIRLVYRNWDGRKLNVRWNHDKYFHEQSTLEENSPYATVRLESYSETTLYEIDVKWDVEGVKYDSKFFPVFSGTDAVLHHEDTRIYFWFLKEQGVYFCKDKDPIKEIYKTWENMKKEYEIKLVYEISDQRQLNVVWHLNKHLHKESTLNETTRAVSVRPEACDATTSYEISVGWSVYWMTYQSKFFCIFKGIYETAYPYTEVFLWSFKEEGVYLVLGESREFRYAWGSLTETITTID